MNTMNCTCPADLINRACPQHGQKLQFAPGAAERATRMTARQVEQSIHQSIVDRRVARRQSHVLDLISEDPDGWISAENRMMAHMINGLREQGVADSAIYAALYAMTGQDRFATQAG